MSSAALASGARLHGAAAPDRCIAPLVAGRSDEDGLGGVSLLMSEDAGGEVQRRNQVGHLQACLLHCEGMQGQ